MARRLSPLSRWVGVKKEHVGFTEEIQASLPSDKFQSLARGAPREDMPRPRCRRRALKWVRQFSDTFQALGVGTRACACCAQSVGRAAVPSFILCVYAVSWGTALQRCQCIHALLPPALFSLQARPLACRTVPQFSLLASLSLSLSLVE